MVDLRAWGASEGSSPAVDEREHLSKGYLTWDWYGLKFSLIKKNTRTFLRKQVVGVVATCWLRACEQHTSKQINHSNIQGNKCT
jgi:hypothetical protein